jgi:hypothetical protein
MRGFSYLWVLIITLTLLSVIGGIATITGREIQRVGLDQEHLQARAYAESGITYYQNIRPKLPCTVVLNKGRFEITEKQAIIYSTGYCQRAVQTIQLKGNKQYLCFD